MGKGESGTYLERLCVDENSQTQRVLAFGRTEAGSTRCIALVGQDAFKARVNHRAFFFVIFLLLQRLLCCTMITLLPSE